jgi:hypothetical protein
MSGFVAYPRATTWMYGVLTSPAITGVLDVYEDEAPEGATSETSKWVTFELLSSGMDVAEVGEQRIWTEFPFAVLVWARTRSTKDLQTIADEIDTRLHRASGTADGGYVIQASRTQEHQEKRTEMGIEYRGLGGVYNLIVQPA